MNTRTDSHSGCKLAKIF